VDVLFLDANVTFSAAYHRDAGLRRLWRLEDVELISSLYAVDELPGCPSRHGRQLCLIKSRRG
jgi:hypothetical protein